MFLKEYPMEETDIRVGLIDPMLISDMDKMCIPRCEVCREDKLLAMGKGHYAWICICQMEEDARRIWK